MRLILVRHAEPNYELDCLTELGHKQAKIAAQRLINEGIEEIYSSPMGRARQTAQAFSDASGIKKIEILDFMHEIRYGPENDLYNEEWSPWAASDKMISKGQELCTENWREIPVFTGNTATIDVDNVMKNADSLLEKWGYKREGFYYRNIRSNDDQHTIALFSHGGSSTALLSRIFNIPFPYLCATLHIPHTGITILRFDRTPGKLAVPVIELACDGRHIQNIH
ncbi:MAG: histidine phosphatase family protein [Treponema sp.]|nr:histidine phosphatase family protein [Treponema sp.]